MFSVISNMNEIWVNLLVSSESRLLLVLEHPGKEKNPERGRTTLNFWDEREAFPWAPNYDMAVAVTC